MGCYIDQKVIGSHFFSSERRLSLYYQNVVDRPLICPREYIRG